MTIRNLTEQNYADLKKSGLSDQILEEHDVKSLNSSEVQQALKRKASIGGGCLFRYPNKTGFMKGIVNIRLDTPMPSKDKGKKPRKYIRPTGSTAHLYIPFPVWKKIDDVTAPLIITEGEKKALKATQEGFLTVSLSGVWGFSSNHKPISDFNKVKIRGRLIYIAFDGDKATNPNVMLAQNRLAKTLINKGAKVKIVDLPLHTKLDDYLVQYGNESFRNLLNEASDYSPSAKPLIEVREGELKNQTDRCWEIISQENKKNPFMFSYGSWPVRIELDKKEGRPLIRQITEPRLRYHLIRMADWVRRTQKRGEIPAIPSKCVLQDFLATPNMNLPYLEGIVESPIFSVDGTLETAPGYSYKTELLYYPKAGFEIPTVSLKPSDKEIECAKSLILNDLLVDFPFTGESEIAHTVALLLLPFVRKMIDGPTPLHLIEKSTPGTGATLLAQCLAWICTGHEYTALQEGRDADEWRKRITAVLQNAPQIIAIDNLSQQLSSASLSSALTETYWSDRILGKSEHKGVPIRCVWIATGNNPVLSKELARRTVRIRMDAKVELPHLRDPSSFKHRNLLLWVKEERAKLVWAVCTIIQAWVQAGMPKYRKKCLGKYEPWSEIIGGVLNFIRLPGFLGNLIDFYDSANIETESNKAFVAAWLKKHKEETVKTSELFDIATHGDVMLPLGDSKSERSQMTRLGLEIKKMQDQVFCIDCGDGILKTVVVEKAKKKIENCASWQLKVKSIDKEPVEEQPKKPRVKVKLRKK